MKYLIIGLFVLATVSFYFYSKSFGFEYKYILNASAEELWEEVRLSFTNSLDSRIWPNRLEVLRSEAFEVGQVVNSTMFIQGKEYPVQFKITKITPGERIEFKPLDDNFIGNDYISVRSIGRDQVEVVWAGNYKVNKLTLGTLFFKYYYLSKFYDEFLKNFSAHWSVTSSSKKVH